MQHSTRVKAEFLTTDYTDITDEKDL